ncbi:MAG TPA: SDR family oxidoreductase [Candidatus Baltobacteraceae bacterium]|nr:SDR family oxidoreductase [Candidatus Baltobacteraceae bacterium]
MDLNIAEKVALVTGASSGLGEACALALAGEGVRVAIAARRERELERVAGAAREAGSPDARAFVVDLSDSSSIDRLLRDVHEQFGRVDILIANGGGPKPGTVTQTSPADWDAAYRAILRSMLQLVDGVVGGMRERRWGRVVALTSTSVKQPIPQLALSNIFRTALVSALKTLAGEVAQDGVTVNAIATGRIETARLRSLYGDDDAALARAGSEVPIGRIARPKELAPLVAFLCGEPARYITGQTIAVDGGLISGLFG